MTRELPGLLPLSKWGRLNSSPHTSSPHTVLISGSGHTHVICEIERDIVRSQSVYVLSAAEKPNCHGESDL